MRSFRRSASLTVGLLLFVLLSSVSAQVKTAANRPVAVAYSPSKSAPGKIAPRAAVKPVPLLPIPVPLRKTIPGGVFVAPAPKPEEWRAAAVEIVAEGRGRINYDAGIIKAIGLAAIAAPTLKKTRAQDILDAREAAFADALRSLSLAVSQVRVTAETRVSKYILEDDEVRTRVKAVLKNAAVMEEKVLTKADVYRVVVQTQISGHNSLKEAIEGEAKRIAESEKPAVVIVESPKPNPYAPGAPAPDGAEYTSLIVDCRGLKVVSCMSPRVYEESGEEVYGTMQIDPEYVIETGIAAFPRTMSAAKNCVRAGKKPLILRAHGVWDSNRFYPVISAQDAERARAGKQILPLL